MLHSAALSEHRIQHLREKKLLVEDPTCSGMADPAEMAMALLSYFCGQDDTIKHLVEIITRDISHCRSPSCPKIQVGLLYSLRATSQFLAESRR